MKHTLNIALVLLLCAATSCIREQDTGIGKTDGPLPVKLNLQLPSDMKGGASSRSMAVENESAISSVELLAFLDDGGGDYRYVYSAPIESTVNNNGQVEIVATAQGYSGQQVFMVLVNAPAGASSGIVRNMALADARQQLLVASANEWNAASSADYKPLPMYTETSAATVTVGTTLGNYDLVRMLARIDVRLKTGVSNFVVTEAHLFNRKTSGQMAFPFDATTWDAAGRRVKKTTYPQAAIPSAYKPSYYDISGYSSTPYGADYRDDSRGEILRSVYTFEAKGVSEADRLDATAVVVGGKYNGSNDVTYYRVDIATDAKPAGYVSQDILRNHLYDIEIQSVAGAGAQTPEDAFKGDIQFKAVVTAYNLAQCGVIFDRQYKLTMSPPAAEFYNEGGTAVVTITTNYDGVDRAHPAGLFISTAGTASWLTVTNGDADGDMSRTLTLTATAYPSASAERETSFTITAGNLNYKYKVTQSKDSQYYIRITNEQGDEIDELTFGYGVETSVPAQKFYLVWNMPAGCTITNADGTPAFAYADGSDRPAGQTVTGGMRMFTIQTTPASPSDVNADPFFTKSSTLTFTTTDGGNTQTKTLALKQTVYNIVAEPASSYLLDGTTQHSFKVKSNTQWAVRSVSDPDGILLNPATQIAGMLTRTGGNNTSPGDDFTFTLVNDTDGSLSGKTYTVTLYDPTGKANDITITVSAVACGCNGTALALRIGTNNYLTHIYGGKCWMVQNSMEGTGSGKAYGLNWAGTNIGILNSGTRGTLNGYYYTLAQAAGACPAGWHLPTAAEYAILYAAVTNSGTAKNNAEGKWWCGSTNGANATIAFAGHYNTNNTTWYGCGDGGYWWYGSGGQYFYGGTNGMGISTNTAIWFSVRCVQD